MRSDHAKPRVVLIGAGPTALSALEGLIDHFEIVTFIRDDDDATSERARSLNVVVQADASLPAVRRTIVEVQPDAVVVSSFNRILDEELVQQCAFVNVHYAPLPRGRGRATVNWAIINGDAEAAISIHRLVPGLDAGGILFQATVPIGPTSTVTSLYEELNELQRRHLAGAVTAAIAGDPGAPQDESKATYLCTRIPDDGEIDWSLPTDQIDRLIRALQEPYPLAFTWLGLERVEIVSAAPVDDATVYEGRIPGRVALVDRAAGSVDVLTGDGVLRLFRVKPEATVEVEAAAVIRSVRQTLGLTTSDVVAFVRQRR